MKSCHHAVLFLALSSALVAAREPAKLPGIGDAMQEMIARNEIAGAVTVVPWRRRLHHGNTEYTEKTWW